MILILTGIPLAFVTGLIAILFTIAWFGPMGVPLVSSRIYSFVNEYVLVAIPMFVLMASLLDRSGMARDLYDAMRLIAGRIKGGVAVQTLVAAVFLAAISGIIGGEIVLLGLIALPQMLRLGYNRALAIGTVCAGGSLGTMIPPSIVLIVYGLTAALYGRISIEGGRVVQSNFHDYKMLSMRDAPRVEVLLRPSGDRLGGVGEPGVPPIAPAVTNALFALTGERVRDLPIALS